MLWSYDTGSSIWTSPAVGSDGTVYVGTSAGLCAITNNGIVASNKWTFSPAFAYFGSPSIGMDGTIYSGDADGNLYAINPDGSQKWVYAARGDRGSPAIGFDNTIYFEGANYLYAINPDGSLKWKFAVGDDGNFTSPSVGPDGTIYLLSSQSAQLYALRPDGVQKWVRDVQPGMAADSPAIGADGTVYVTAVFLYAFALDGRQLWYTPTNNFTGFSPVVARDGTAYLKDFNTRFLDALDSSGHVMWSVLQDGAHTVPTVAALDVNGTLYYCVSNTLAALNSEGETQWSFTATPEESSPANGSPAIGDDGTIYAVFGTKIYAIYNTNKLEDSAWPMCRQNVRHTGKIERPSLQQPRKRDDGSVEFQLYAQIDQTQTVQASTDLVSWTEVANVVVTKVPMTVLDLSSTNFTTRFYRTVSP
jgi:outer membrane protein assembly factor BamB